MKLTVVIAGLTLITPLALGGCNSARSEAQKQVQPVYDAKTGKLTVLNYDSNRNGKTDTWCYTDGTIVVRCEIDNDEDGKLDRWEFFRPDQKIEKVGLSPKHDGQMTRVEYYDPYVILRAEEDTDGDSKIDKWETYEGGRLASVAFDTLHRGVPDRRLLYGADGSVQLEVDAKGDGHFVRSR